MCGQFHHLLLLSIAILWICCPSANSAPLLNALAENEKISVKETSGIASNLNQVNAQNGNKLDNEMPKNTANSANQEPFSEWTVDPRHILVIVLLVFIIYFFGSIWFFCTFLAPIRAAFPPTVPEGRNELPTISKEIFA